MVLKMPDAMLIDTPRYATMVTPHVKNVMMMHLLNPFGKYRHHQPTTKKYDNNRMKNDKDALERVFCINTSIRDIICSSERL